MLWLNQSFHIHLRSWRHQMEIFFTLLALCAGNSPVTGDAELWCFLHLVICAWTNSWINNRDAGNLRRHRTRYDVTVMLFSLEISLSYFLFNIKKTVDHLLAYFFYYSNILKNVVLPFFVKNPIFSVRQIRFSVEFKPRSCRPIQVSDKENTAFRSACMWSRYSRKQTALASC